MHARLSAKFNDVVYRLRSVQHWCQYIRQDRELLDDEPRLGRPPTDFLDIQILSSLEKQPFHLAYSLAEILDVSHTTILNHLRHSLGMKLFHLRWIPNQLTEQPRASMIAGKDEVKSTKNLLPGDESWFMLEYQHAVKWSVSREDVSERVRQQIGTKIYTHCCLGSRRLYAVDLVTSQRSFDSEQFMSHLLAPMVAKVFPRGRIPHTRRL
jgi:hypothetical protein